MSPTDHAPTQASARRVIPAGARIVNIRRGSGHRAGHVYAKLVAPDGELLINATLDQITEQVLDAEIAPAVHAVDRSSTEDLRLQLGRLRGDLEHIARMADNLVAAQEQSDEDWRDDLRNLAQVAHKALEV